MRWGYSVGEATTVRALTRVGDAVPLALVQTADTWAARAVGLLGRRGLAPNEGLYLAPCRSVHTIGMRFSLDLVFVDRALTVVRLVPSLAPWRAALAPAAFGVIELATGSIGRHKFRIGDELSLDRIPDLTTQETLA